MSDQTNFSPMTERVVRLHVEPGEITDGDLAQLDPDTVMPRRHVTAYNILLPTFINDSSGIISVRLFNGKHFAVQEGGDVADLLLIEEAPHAT